MGRLLFHKRSDFGSAPVSQPRYLYLPSQGRVGILSLPRDKLGWAALCLSFFFLLWPMSSDAHLLAEIEASPLTSSVGSVEHVLGNPGRGC